MVHTLIGLLLEPSKCKGMIPRFGYDNEHSFEHFISIQSEHTKQSMWALFHGMDAKERF